MKLTSLENPTGKKGTMNSLQNTMTALYGFCETELVEFAVGTNQKCNGYYNIRITLNEYVGGSRSHYPYKAFKMALYGFQYLKSFCCISIDHYYHSLSLVDTTIMVSNKYLNIGEQVMVIFFSFFLFYLESYHSNDITCKKP